MSDKVRCTTHGETQATYVCRHIVDSLDTAKAVACNWPADTGLSRPDAWCWECNKVCRSEGGESTDEGLEFVQVTVLCGGCYDRAKAIWLRARASVKVRGATAADAIATCEVLRASISELCVADHHTPPKSSAGGLANKTLENVTAWAADGGASLLLAVEGDTILAVGSVRNHGEITLNHVSPAARYRARTPSCLRRLKRAPQSAPTQTAPWSRPKPRVAFILRGAR